jgi:hypothetical protein
MKLELYIPTHRAEEVERVLQEALELHIKGLEAAKQAATTDGTIETAEELLDVARDIDGDCEIADLILGRLHDSVSG